MRIAVFVPIYNDEYYFIEQINNILNEDFFDLELFLFDDGESVSIISNTKKLIYEKVHNFHNVSTRYVTSFIGCMQLADNFDYYVVYNKDIFLEKGKLDKIVQSLFQQMKGSDIPAVYYSNVNTDYKRRSATYTITSETGNEVLRNGSIRHSDIIRGLVFNHRLKKEILEKNISKELLAQCPETFIVSLCYALGGVVCCDKRINDSHSSTILPHVSVVDTKDDISKKAEGVSLYRDKQSEIKTAKLILEGWCNELPMENKDVLNLIVRIKNEGNKRISNFLELFSVDYHQLTPIKKIKAFAVQKYIGGILKKIDNSTTVSFDIFDTLVSRDVCNVDMLYQLMESDVDVTDPLMKKNFAAERRNAEILAAQKYNGCATTMQIYSEMANLSLFSKEKIQDFVKKEEELEFSLCTPKYEGRLLYEYCLWKQKCIVLISDMHLSKEVILRMLRKCRYRNFDVNSVFISCEMASTKRSGKLFNEIALRGGIEKKNWIHIGDAKRSDWIMPKKVGLHSIYVPNEINHFKYKRNLKRRIDCGPLCKQHCDCDKKLKDEVYTKIMNNRLPWVRGTYERFGYECLGSLLWGFTVWLSRELLNGKDDEAKRYDRIYFLAREGQLLKKAYDIVNEGNKSIYLPVSRKSLNGAALWMIRGIKEKIASIPFSEEFGIEQIEDKLGIKLPENLKSNALSHTFTSYEDVLQCKDIVTWLTEHEDDIDEYSHEQYVLFMKLLKLDMSVRRVAIIDIGWKGTMQHNLELLLSHGYCNVTVDGYYLGVSCTAKKAYPQQHMKGFLFKEIDENKFFAFSGLLEGIMTANHGSVRKYETSSSGNVGYCCYPYEYEGDCRVDAIQNGALQLLRDIRGVLDKYGHFCITSKMSDVSELWSAGRIVRFGYLPNKNDIALFHNFSFFDGYVNIMNNVKKRNIYQFKSNLRQSKWKTAYLKQTLRVIPFASQLYVLVRRAKNWLK